MRVGTCSQAQGRRRVCAWAHARRHREGDGCARGHMLAGTGKETGVRVGTCSQAQVVRSSF